MKNPSLLYDYYIELLRVHQAYFPNLSFDQFLSNFFGWLVDRKKIDECSDEGDGMIGYLKEYVGEQ